MGQKSLLRISSDMRNKENLLNALIYYGINVLDDSSSKIQIEKGYAIEIESNGIYKLLGDGQVIAPFDDLDELCRFIKM
jgi:hypothetical protein